MLLDDPARLIAGRDADAQVVALVRKHLGLNLRLSQQFWQYITQILQGDFGISMVSKRPVLQEITQRFLPTLYLTFTSMVWSVTFGIAIGIISAIWRDCWPDRCRVDTGDFWYFFPAFCPRYATDPSILSWTRLAYDGGR